MIISAKQTSAFFLLLITSIAAFSQGNHTQYVDPFIGTGGHGHTYPGATLPFGMVQLSPDTRLEGWDGCSAYHYSDSVIYGFSHTHLSGTGCSDYGDILFMPIIGNVALTDYSWRSTFDHESETAHPGYYSVLLKDNGIFAELTTTSRTGFHRYTYPESGNAGLIIDLKHRDKVLESSLKMINDSTIIGFRRSKAWAKNQYLYFAAVFSVPIEKLLISIDNKDAKSRKSAKGSSIIALLNFKKMTNNQLLIKVGLSAVDCNGAIKNLYAENPGQDFGLIAQKADAMWEKELSAIDATGGSDEQKTVFYTSLYHALLSPNLYSDVDGNYRGRDLKIHNTGGYDYYTVFSLWDTYRAAHPLFTLIQQKRTVDFIKTFISQYEQGGTLPVWELSGNETGCMIGYHAVSVIADAFIKGINGFDTIKALEAMKHSANLDHLGLSSYKKTGYVSSDEESESVSKTLEYAYDDWCIAKMAAKMGNTEDYKKFIIRAQSYKNLFDPSSGFMRARTNGGWFSPFDPAEVNQNYTEANAWQYSFYVPQDIDGLISLQGGKEKFAEKLDKLFNAKSQTTGREQADITGLIGQYAHGNEPSHHMAYLYCYANMPWKTQEIVHQIQSELYQPAPDGLCGNEDCGQMSSWLVLSALGFYPVTPGSDVYTFGTPMFESVAIKLENNKEFIIRTENLSPENFYIQAASLNGTLLERFWISHQEIIDGGELLFVMGSQPNYEWGKGQGNDALSSIKYNLITPVPFLMEGKPVFKDSTMVVISDALHNSEIHYTTDGSIPNEKSLVYTQPLVIKATTEILARAFFPNQEASGIMISKFSRISGNSSISIKNLYAPQYSAGGDQALVDNKLGTPDFRTGAWQGYEGVDLDAVLDLGKVKNIKSLSIRFLQDQNSWIFMPESVEYLISENGIDYKSVGNVKNNIPQERDGSVIEEFTLKLKPVNIRFIHIFAHTPGTCPLWHAGAGKKCWIFADEITFE